MVEIKAAKTNEGLLLSGALPAELLASSSLDIFALRDGFYLVSLKGAPEGAARLSHGAGEAGSAGNLSGNEKELVRKLLSVRFEKRTPPEMNHLLSKGEKETLGLLIQKKLVHIFHGGKYEKDGVYNVSDFAFNAVREPSAPAMPSSQQAQPQPQMPSGMSPSPIPISISSPSHLESHGWMVLENESDARNFGAAFQDKVKSGEIRGVRAFDMKYYFVRRGFCEQWEGKVQSALSKNEKSSAEIAQDAGMEPEGCRALLFHMCDSGEAMEKRRGKFTKA